ncbi:MAG: response regulator transcription factor [Opitutaceae bacterium]|nr:response regulator transcription factor [Opitutaceae bacterium]
MEENHTARGQTRVVIIDDHVAIDELVAELIDSTRGCRMLGWAQTETEALDLCRREQPDVIILDLVLPGTSGFLLLGKLREACAGARVMIFSGNLNPQIVQRVLAVGVLGIVGKTSTLDEFRRALLAVAEGKTYFSRDISAVVKDLVVRPQWSPLDCQGGLSRREKTVLGYLAQGLSSREIASQLGVSVYTVANHRSRLMKKTGLHRATQLSLYAAELGLVGTHVDLARNPSLNATSLP